MANLQPIDGNDFLINQWPKLDQNTRAVNDELGQHKASTTAHSAEHITYNGAVVGASDVQHAIDTVKTTLDQAIITGDSGPEAAAARSDSINGVTYSTLKDRLDTEQATLAAQFAALTDGVLRLPSTFPRVPFNICRKGRGVYTHDATPYNQHDWSGAVNIYISSYGATSGAGTDVTQPINFGRFISNYDSGVYAGATKFILNVMDNVYAQLSGGGAVIPGGIDVLIRSTSINGFSWIGRLKTVANTGISAWVADSGVYKTTQATAHEAIDVINVMDLSEPGGMPKPYIKVSSLAECQATPGTFYQETSTSADVYCNPYPGHRLNHLMMLVSTKIFTISSSAANTIMFENIGLFADSYSFAPTNLNARLYFFNCKFHRGRQDAFGISGLYQVYLFNCVAAHASKDGFNYHSATKDSVAVEVNCLAYNSGKYKMPGGNTTRHSNNGSTAHDGMNMLRVGSRYFDCEGPVVADVNNCQSISIECDVGSVLPTTTGTKTAFQFYNTDNTNRPDLIPQYVIGCTVTKGYNDYAIVGETNTYELGTRGNRVFSGGVQTLQNWGL